MSKIDDGGAAFPSNPQAVSYKGKLYRHGEGMSLRDWFAGKVLASGATPTGWEPETTADYCYKRADAMIARRDK